MTKQTESTDCPCPYLRQPATSGARNAHLSPAEQELLNFVSGTETISIAMDMKRIFDLALFHSDVEIHQEDKTALYNVIHLAELIRKLAKD